MPQLNFVMQGRGPVVVLAHALGCDLTMWDGVAQQLQKRFSVLRYDHRGHGHSPVPPGPYTLAGMAADVAELITTHSPGPVHFVGLSMGGMVAQQLAVDHPDLISSIVIANSSSHYDDTGRALWKARIETVLNTGMRGISEGAMQRWFTPEFREQDSASVAAISRTVSGGSSGTGVTVPLRRGRSTRRSLSVRIPPGMSRRRRSSCRF